ncbi:hypothetical protein KJ654_04050 [Patescibacteria group bacterium]|nr:hypothetical protein [Patescibacteria group bacterium]
MKKIFERITFSQVQERTWEVIKIDNVLHWVLGATLILVPDFFNRVFFGHEVLSHWIYIVMGFGLVWFASWQTEHLLKKRQLTVPALRFSAVLAWLLAVILIWALLSGLGSRMLLVSRIIVWLVGLSILVLGALYWWVAGKIKED